MNALRELLIKERKELQNKEIVLIEEHKEEIGLYALVFIKPMRVRKCFCKDKQFLSMEYIYRFGYGYRLSDKLDWVGTGCVHFLYDPTQEQLDRLLPRALKTNNKPFLIHCETDLEKQFEQAFGAA